MIRRFKEQWQKLASGLYVPPYLKMGHWYHGVGGRCCCKGILLLWDADHTVLPPGGSQMSHMVEYYQSIGIKVDNQDTWTETLDDYPLIIWPQAGIDPPWWDEISEGTWSGRFHITAEASFADAGYVDGKSEITGINVIFAEIDPFCAHLGTVEVDDLTNGMTDFMYALTSKVSGGTTLSKTVTGAHPWIARNKSGNIDWVVAGDVNHLNNVCNSEGLVIDTNKEFLKNLVSVAT